MLGTLPLKTIRKGSGASHRAHVRHSYPYAVNTMDFGYASSTVKIDESMRFLDLQDVLQAAIGSESGAAKALVEWRRKRSGDDLGALLQSADVGPVLPSELIKIKWTTGSVACAGKARMAATVHACDAILAVLSEARKMLARKGAPKVHLWLKRLQRTSSSPRLSQEGQHAFDEERVLPDSLALMADKLIDTWTELPAEA